MQERLVHAGSSPGTENRAVVERVGTVVLVAVVAAMLLMLVVDLFYAGVHRMLSVSGVTVQSTDRAGIELVAFPLAAIAGAILRPRISSIGALRARSIAPWLPLLAACAFAVLVCIPTWSWFTAGEGLWHGPERLFGAAALASVAILIAVLFPRISAVLAGAIAAPALLVVIVFPFQDSLAATAEYSLVGYWLINWSLPAALVVSAALLAASVLLRSHVISHAAWSGALTLPLAVYGFLHPCCTM